MLTGVTVLGLGGCRKQAPPTPTVVSTPVPPRPSEVLAEVIVPAPRALWPEVRKLAGPLGNALPQGPELAVAAFLGVPALSANSFDLDAPLVALWTGGAGTGLVLALHLQSGPEFIAKLTTGSSPSHDVKRRGALSFLYTAAEEPRFSFAVANDRLLIGPLRFVERVGEYAVRVLAPNATSKGPITFYAPGENLRTHLVPTLRASWAKRRGELADALQRERAARGRPADWADPSTLLVWLDQVVESAILVLESTREVRAELTSVEGSRALSFRLLPDSTGRAASLVAGLHHGDIAPLRALPQETALALMLRHATAAPSDGAAWLLSLLGERLTKTDAATLERALADLHAGRGDVDTVALTSDLGVLWRGPVTDAARMRSGVSELLPLVTHKPWSDAVTGRFGRPVLVREPTTTTDDTTIERAHLRFTPSSATKPGVAFATLVSKQRFVVAAAASEKAPLDAALRAEASGARPPLTALLDEKRDTAGVLAADLVRLGLASSEDAAAPLSVEWGACDGALCVTARSTDAALRALVARGIAP